ncbi:MAG TPA: hypothetical protein VN181_06525 [Thermoanaerobaculia bacterium]|nr:hypothetical protein [Thermoanaerobaculia bacterium]
MKLKLIASALLLAALLWHVGVRELEQYKVAMLRYAANAILRTI